MACESPIYNDFKTCNDMIYAEMEKELKILENDGYKCVIVGELNAHVGLTPRGIDGNRAGVNYYGKIDSDVELLSGRDHALTIRLDWLGYFELKWMGGGNCKIF